MTVTRTVTPGTRRPSAPGQGAPSQLSLKNTGRQAYVPHRDAEGTGISIESLSQVGWTELEEQPGVTGYQRFWPGLLAGPGPGLGPGPFRTPQGLLSIRGLEPFTIKVVESSRCCVGVS